MERNGISKAYGRAEQLLSSDEHSKENSSAKQYSRDGLEGTSLMNAPDAGQAFDSARCGQPGAIANEGSQQVKEAGPALELRPPPEIARGPDQEKHQADMARDDAASRLAEFKATAESAQDRNADLEQEHDHGNEPG